MAASGAADVDLAQTAAARAFPAWAALPVTERAAMLERLAGLVERDVERLALLESTDSGKPLSLARSVDIPRAAANLRFFAEAVREWKADEDFRAPHAVSRVMRRPSGVAGCISPWNLPLYLFTWKIAPALAAGCTVVAKPSEETPLTAAALGELSAEAGFPAGVLNVVPGGVDAGKHLVSHPGVDKVSFTGSTVAGRIIAEVCGRLLRPVTLELGGKSAAIILDDADLDATLRGLRSVSFVNNGQTCYLGSRILAPRSRYAEVVDALVNLVDGFTVGDPLDGATDIGPVVTARQRDRVLGYIEAGNDSGARLVAGGGIPKDQPRGWFVSPTVFADVDNSDRIAQEEIFGPVLAVIAYDDDADAIALANDSQFGLAGTVWSTDADRATDVARAVKTGTIGVNGYQLDMGAPFGGVKASGLGRELGPEGLEEFFDLKSIYRIGPP